MSIKTDLKALVGQPVLVDQSPIEPNFIEGMLEDMGDDAYGVGSSEQGSGAILFSAYEVSRVKGHRMTMSLPPNSDDFDETEKQWPADSDEISGW